MRVSSDIDPRPLREIYLRAFQHVVEHAQPWTVMCSYNRLNGVYASQDRWLLTEVLREQWGFEGLVVSDWGAVDDRVAGLAAGLDLEMPSSDGRTDAQIVQAVHGGRLDEAYLDTAARRVVDLVAQGSGASGRGRAARRGRPSRSGEGGSCPLDRAAEERSPLGRGSRPPAAALAVRRGDR